MALKCPQSAVYLPKAAQASLQNPVYLTSAIPNFFEFLNVSLIDNKSFHHHIHLISMSTKPSLDSCGLVGVLIGCLFVYHSRPNNKDTKKKAHHKNPSDDVKDFIKFWFCGFIIWAAFSLALIFLIRNS